MGREAKPTGSSPGTRSRGPWWDLSEDEFTKGAQRVLRGAFPCKTLAPGQGGAQQGAAPRWGAGLRARPLQSALLEGQRKGPGLETHKGKPPEDALLPTEPGNSLVAQSRHCYAGGRTASSPSPWGGRGGGPPCPCPTAQLRDPTHRPSMP